MALRVLFWALFAALATCAQATTADFNALTAGTSYPAGSIFNNGGLTIELLYATENMTVAAASSPINPSFTGNYLNLPNTDLLDLNLPTGASQIQFDFIQSGTAEALTINGAFINFDQIPTTVNGVTVTWSLGSKTTPWGHISATGVIDSFFILGNQLKIDNVNATLAPGLAGDYNKNHAVDAGDYPLWRKNLNTRSGYDSWRLDFGAVGANGSGFDPTSVAVPEPATLGTMLFGLPIAVLFRARNCRVGN